MQQAAAEAQIQIVTGDTKVVPHGAADKIFINTAGLGLRRRVFRSAAIMPAAGM